MSTTEDTSLWVGSQKVMVNKSAPFVFLLPYTPESLNAVQIKTAETWPIPPFHLDPVDFLSFTQVPSQDGVVPTTSPVPSTYMSMDL